MVRDLLDRGLQAIAIQGGGEVALALVGAAAGLAALGVTARNMFRKYEVVVLPQSAADTAADLGNALRMPRWVSANFLVHQLMRLGLSTAEARKWADDAQKDPDASRVLADCLLTRNPEVGKKVVLSMAGLPYLNVVDNGWEVRVWLIPPKNLGDKAERRWSVAHDRLAAAANREPAKVLGDLMDVAGERLPQWMRQPNVRLEYYGGCPVMLRWERPEEDA